MDLSTLTFRPELVRRYTEEGFWVEATTNEALEEAARKVPDKVAVVDVRQRITYAQYYREAQRLAAHWLSLGLTKDDVIGVQLPNWSEFAIAVNSAMLAGIPFCQFHADFRSKEVEIVLGFTDAAAVIVPRIRLRGHDPRTLAPSAEAQTRARRRGRCPGGPVRSPGVPGLGRRGAAPEG